MLYLNRNHRSSALTNRAYCSPKVFHCTSAFIALVDQRDQIFYSKWLITQLNRFGFYLGYDKVQRYKYSVLVNKKTNYILKIHSGSFIEWMVDNVDPNSATINSKSSLQGCRYHKRQRWVHYAMKTTKKTF